MILCADCRHSDVLDSKTRKYKFCSKLTPVESQGQENQSKWVICMNAREEGAECGPQGRFWESK